MNSYIIFGFLNIYLFNLVGVNVMIFVIIGIMLKRGKRILAYEMRKPSNLLRLYALFQSFRNVPYIVHSLYLGKLTQIKPNS